MNVMDEIPASSPSALERRARAWCLGSEAIPPRPPVLAIAPEPEPAEEAPDPPARSRFAIARALVADNPLLLPIAGIGFAVSFQTIARLAALQQMPGWPVLYPILIDVGFLAAIVEARKAIDDGRSDLAPRLLAWGLGALTLYVNAHGSPAGDWLGLTLHVAAPALWIAFLELSRWRKVRKAAAAKMDRIPLARWLFMPTRTLRMKRRMVIHNVRSYPVAVAREEALLLARGLVRAASGRKWRWRKTAPALMRHHLATGTLPEAVGRLAMTASSGVMPAMAEPVTEWVAQALTQTARMAVKVAAEKRVIEASAAAQEPVTETVAPPRQTARQKSSGGKGKTTAKVRRLLAQTNPRLTREEVARKAGVSVSTVDRVKRAAPSPLRAVAEG